MSFYHLFSCCFNEVLVPEDSKLLLVYTDKSLTHYQKCVLEYKTTAYSLCQTIMKTQGLLQAKFHSLHKKHKITPGEGAVFLILICRENYVKISTRIINFFEFPLFLMKNKLPEMEYLFLVMKKSEIIAFNEEKNYEKQIKINHLRYILDKGRLSKKNRMGDYIEKYFVLTKQVLLYLDLFHKNKKMHVLELENMKIEKFNSTVEEEVLQIETPQKVYLLKADSRKEFNHWMQKLAERIKLVKQNSNIFGIDNKIFETKLLSSKKIDMKIMMSFENIENLLCDNQLREWFFEFIKEISPKEGGLLILLEFYIKFTRELNNQNFKEAFKNCFTIYEVIKKILNDWENKDLFAIQEIETQDLSKQNLVKRMSKKESFGSPIKEKKPLKMYHMKNNTPFSDQKSGIPKKNTSVVMALKKSDQKKPSNNQFTKRKISKTAIRSRKDSENIDHESNFSKENIRENFVFHEDFFLKICRDFDWDHCESKFFYMKSLYLKNGIDSQIVDIFIDLFLNVVKYLEINYYHLFLDSDFYKTKLLFFQIQDLKKKMSFDIPFISNKIPKISEFNVSQIPLMENPKNSSKILALKNKKVVSTFALPDLQMEEILTLEGFK